MTTHGTTITAADVRAINEAAMSGSLCAAVLSWAQQREQGAIVSYALWRSLVARRAWLARIELDWLDSYAAASPDVQIRAALIAEYGRVLDILASGHFTVSQMRTADLIRPAADHRPSGHADWDPAMPAALVLGRRVIDGYHRVAEAERRHIAELAVIQAT